MSSAPCRSGGSVSGSSSSTTGARPTSIEVIQAHKSPGNGQFGTSEANTVIDNFNKLSERDKQDLLNFLRSL